MEENLLLLSATDNSDDLLLLSPSNHKSQEKIEFHKNFQVEILTNEQCKTMFRFEKDDLPRIQMALRIPQKIVCRNRTIVSGTEGLCILLRRLAYPNRLEDLTSVFGRPVYELSYIFNEVLNIVYHEHGHLLSDLTQPWLSQANLDTFTTAISDRGSPLLNCWGFIDGTVRPICRPESNQKMLFSGHKRTHGVKFQSITAPNGLIANLYGPVEGCRHDAGMLRVSGILNQLEDKMTKPDGTVYSLYGDPAYPLRPHLIGPFKGAALSEDEKAFNKRMSAVRISVEWIFGKIISLFAFLDYKKNNKLYLQPVGKYYLIGALLTNVHTCLYGSETSTFFNIDPPALEDYLNNS